MLSQRHHHQQLQQEKVQQGQQLLLQLVVMVLLAKLGRAVRWLVVVLWRGVRCCLCWGSSRWSS
jgi:hypothetical protein